jgi:hypothetical protein
MRFLYKITPIFALLLFSLLTPGCANSGTAPPSCPSFPATDCRIVIPQCKPPAIVGMPHEAISRLGFHPYVATWLPETVTWYIGGAYSSQPRPLMRIEYAFWFPRPYNGYAPHAVIAFDETTQALGFTANIYVPGQTLRITSKTPVEINGHAATLFELQSSGATGTSTSTSNDGETHVIGALWQVGTVWVRVTAVTSGRYFLDINGNGDDVAAWEGTSTDVLLRVARSARVYTGCDKSTFGASTRHELPPSTPQSALK